MISFIKGVGLKVWGYVALAGFALAFMGKIYLAGINKQKMDQLNKSLDSIKRSDEIEDDVNQLSDDDVIKRLRDKGWFRQD